MKIRGLHIQNLRSLIDCKMEDIPDLVVLAGPNGAGKSTVLEAITLWKQHVVNYSLRSGWGSLRDLVTKGKDSARIEVTLELEETDVQYLAAQHVRDVPEVGHKVTTSLTIRASGGTSVEVSNWGLINPLLRYPDRKTYPQAAIFDYYGPYRYLPPREFNSFDANALSLQQEENRRIQPSVYIEQKADQLKDFLYSLYQKDAEWFIAMRDSLPQNDVIQLSKAPDSFADIRRIVNSLLPHLKFKKVASGAPVEFLFEGPAGQEIDLDHLSSGEKAILSLFIEMHRLAPRNSILLLDEPELHLHQSVEARIVPHILSEVVTQGNNQVFIVTHSPGVLAGTASSNLYRVTPWKNGSKQVTRISTETGKVETLKLLVGNLGIFTASDVFVFLEGTEGSKSFDKMVLETLLPELRGKVTFVPVGSCEVVEIVSKRVQEVLDQGIPFGRFLAIRDRDRMTDDRVRQLNSEIPNLRVWPRCMLENFLLDATVWSAVAKSIGLNHEPQDAAKAFETAAKNMRDEEIDLRLDEVLRAHLSMKDFRNSPRFSTTDKLLRARNQVDAALADLAVKRQEIETAVDEELRNGRYLCLFHGKTLLKEVKRVLSISMTNEYFMPLLTSTMRTSGNVPPDLIDTLKSIVPDAF